MPTAPSKNPRLQHSAATKPLFLGPAAWTHLPNSAAEAPSTKIAIVKIQPSEVSFQSLGRECEMPSCRVSGRLNTLSAYTWPMHKCVASAQGGTSQRL